MELQNFGLINEPPPVGEWVFRGLSGAGDREVLAPDRDWTGYLPIYESQKTETFDTLGCVTFSALNCLETTLIARNGSTRNFSDRFTAKMSGTTKAGNTLWAVAESIKNDGLVEEKEWPFSGVTWEEYYKEIPSAIVNVGKVFAERTNVTREYVSPDAATLWEALQFAPIQVTLCAFPPIGKDGIYHRTLLQPNHAVMLYSGVFGETFMIYDHYIKAFKTLSWDYKFWSGLMYSIEQTPMTFIENTLYQLVDPPGGFYLYAGGRLRRDSLDKLLASWVVRNNGNTVGKVGTLRSVDLPEVGIINLKNEPV